VCFAAASASGDDTPAVSKDETVIPDHIIWSWRGKTIEIGVESCGDGPLLIMLPAFSSISTRSEMRPLANEFASTFRTVCIDWPGFGDRRRPAIAWEPPAYRSFLRHILQEFSSPSAVVVAGHAAGYLLAHAAEHPHSAGKLCLLAPTWRGPLPTMLGERWRMFLPIARLIDLPVVGAVLYRLNVNKPMIRMMARGHVYANPSWLDRDRLCQKLAVTKTRGARYASFRFVAGALDPMLTRESFLAVAQRVNDPILLIYGAATPRRSKAEMEALAKLPGVQSCELPMGKLAIHEEFPSLVAEAIRSFLGRAPAA